MLDLTWANNMSSLTQQMAASPHGWIKINVDEATTKSLTVLALVARDDNGIAIKVWSRTHHICSPLQAEATAILWTATCKN